MSTLTKEDIKIEVDKIKKISNTDLADLCSVTEQAIRAGGGFGWLTIPPRDTLKNYWNGLVLIKTKKCKFISRIQVEFGVFLDWVVGKMMSRC